MTPLERVRATRRTLVALIVASAGLWGVAAGLVAYAAVVFVVGRGGWALVAGAVIGLATLGARLWRGRAAWSLERAALWVETRAPALEYALVTAIEPQAAAVVAALTPRVERVAVGPLLQRAGVRVIGWAVAGVLIALVLVAAVPARPLGVWDRHSGRVHPVAAIARNRLVPLTVQVMPPAYAHQPARELREPTTISALVGSTIVLSGHGDGVGIRGTTRQGTTGTDSLAVVTHDAEHSNAGWSMRLTMPAKAAVIRLTDRSYERVVGLDPVIDNPPTVTLTHPARDSTMRTASGTLVLEAEATDDIGLADGFFELIISAGEEEGSFTSTERRVGAVTLGGATRSAALRGQVDLAALKLTPGGLLSIRAVAHDGNTISGPGVGTSETRTLRLAKPQEYDSVAVEGAPPATLDSTYLSQRMIIIQTEALVRAAKHLKRDSVVHTAQRLGDKEQQLRYKVQVLLHGSAQGEGEGGEDAGGQLLPEWERALFDTAYQALTDAGSDLGVAEPKVALGPEYVALHALDKARIAKRLYLRGTPPTIVVNIDRVRLSGTEKADAGPRPPGTPSDTVAVTVLRRLESAAILATRAPPAAADSLTLLRADVLATWPAAGTALGDAVTALRAGRDASVALGRARGVVAGSPRVESELARWDGGAQ